MPTSLQVDAFGFIKNDSSEDRDLLTKGPNTFRIFMLGGSTIAGIGAGTNENTISTHLERALNAASDGGPRVFFEVINAGVGGYQSTLELIYLS
ncbi:TPA: hypothetical protein DCE37_11540 [Candidatus Latescibacteria bacterium]|nr:hypothetical protein [Candidatus Latescibacterota bacterium]